MFTLKEIFEELSTGELTNLAVGNAEVGTIAAADYPKIVRHINQALLKLHTRFPLRDDHVLVQQYASITRYNIDTDHAASNPDATGVQYLLDSDRPFTDQVTKIEQVFNMSEEFEIPPEFFLNDKSNPNSLHTPRLSILDMPPLDPPVIVKVLYRASHPAITVTGSFDPTQETVDIPEYILEPLLAYVGFRIINNRQTGVLGQEQPNIGGSFLAHYETACKRIEMEGLCRNDNTTDDKIKRGGWV